MSETKHIIISCAACIALFSSCEKELTVTPPEKKPDNGYVYITSYPEKLEIFLNGRRTGSFTPDSITWQKSGEAVITLKKNLFRDSSITVQFENGKRINVEIDYRSNKKMYGSIKCVSHPTGAEIFLNDSSTGKHAPNVLTNLWPGEYNIKFQKDGYREDNRNILVQSNMIVTSEFALEDTSVWVTYDMSNSGIQSDELTTIAVDSHNNKWIGTASNGIIVFDEKSFRNINMSNSLIPDKQIIKILIDKNDKKYVSTPNGFAMLDGENWTIYDTTNSLLPSKYVTAFDVSSSGGIYVGTKEGLIRYHENDNTWVLLTRENYSFLPDGKLWINAVKFADNQDYWMSIKNKGIVWYHDSGWCIFGYFYQFNTCVTESASADVNNITEIAFGNNSQVWFCNTEPAGSQLLSFTPPYLWNDAHLFAENTINSIYVAENDFVWLATAKGLVKYKKDVYPIVVYTKASNCIKEDYCSDTVRDKNGMFWITTLGGGLTKKKNMD